MLARIFSDPFAVRLDDLRRCLAVDARLRSNTHAAPAGHPRVAIAIALLAWLVFALVTYEVITRGALVALDPAAMAWAAARRSPALTDTFQWLSHTGGPSITSVYAGLLIVLCLARRRFATALVIALIVYGAAGLNVAVKEAIHRTRPVVDHPLVTLPTYSFPSGHAAASTVFGGLLIVVCVPLLQHARLRIIATALIVAWIAGVCASRIYLGAHYPSDVLAGMLEGTGWLLCWWLAVPRPYLSLQSRID